MSMTRTLFDLGSDADILFVHAARTPADIIFRRELEAIAAVMPNIRVVHICESDYPSERWMGLRGRLTTAALQAIAPDLAERRDLHLRAARLHGRRPPGPRRDRLRHGQLPRGELLLRQPAG